MTSFHFQIAHCSLSPPACASPDPRARIVTRLHSSFLRKVSRTARSSPAHVSWQTQWGSSAGQAPSKPGLIRLCLGPHPSSLWLHSSCPWHCELGAAQGSTHRAQSTHHPDGSPGRLGSENPFSPNWGAQCPQSHPSHSGSCARMASPMLASLHLLLRLVLKMQCDHFHFQIQTQLCLKKKN